MLAGMKRLLSIIFIISISVLAAESDYEPGQILLKPKNREGLYRYAAALGLEKIQESYPLVLYRVPDTMAIPSVARLLNESGLVHWAEPN